MLPDALFSLGMFKKYTFRQGCLADTLTSLQDGAARSYMAPYSTVNEILVDLQCRKSRKID